MKQKVPKTQDAAPINDHFWMRLVVIFLSRFCNQKWYRRWQNGQYTFGVLYISSKLCLRRSSHTLLNEARAMQIVKQNTSLPVPKVYCSFKTRHRVYILQERMPGKPLAVDWVYRPDESRAKILDQLRAMIAELRTVARPPPQDSMSVSGIDGGTFYEGNLPDKDYWGPYATVKDFHRDVRDGYMHVPDEYPAEPYDDLRKVVALHENYVAAPPVLTHGDLSPANILADGDMVTGIVDWETAAWMPAYWEYTNAWHVSPYHPYWQEEVGKFIEPWPQELEMEKLRRMFFKPF